MITRHCHWVRHKRTKSLFILLVAFTLVACSPPETNLSDAAQGPTLPVAAQFDAFYELAGGRRLLGDPITEAFRVESEGPLLQYFQAMRLAYEEHPAVSGSGQVTVFALGEWALAGLSEQNPAPVEEGGPSRYFPETGISVRGEFHQFYETYNGEQLLGPPISVELSEEGLRVQYFRNSRLEFHPELPEGQQVRLGYLGQAHFDAVMAFSYRRALSIQFVPSINVTTADVFAYVEHPILYAGDQQQLYITVMTPEGRSVSGLKVDVLVTYGDKNKHIEQELADGKNKVRLPLDAADIVPGEQVKILVSVLGAGDNALGTDQLTFKTWW